MKTTWSVRNELHKIKMLTSLHKSVTYWLKQMCGYFRQKNIQMVFNKFSVGTSFPSALSSARRDTSKKEFCYNWLALYIAGAELSFL